jgi:hypothetical protein
MKHFSASVAIHLTLLQFAGVLLVVWLIFGDPVTAVANLFYPAGPAPWEKIELVYFPDRHISSVYERTPDVGSLEECRNLAWRQAARRDDRDLERGAYECRVAAVHLFGAQPASRLSLE